VTTAQIILLIAAVWLVTAVVVTLVMGRRGHDLFNWAVLSVIFGPLAILLAIDAVRREPRAAAAPKRIHAGSRGPGSVRVLVGIDSSAESNAALRHAVELLGERIGVLTLAAVIDYDAAQTSRPWGVEADAERTLERSAAEVTAFDPETIVLAGAPATALAEHATTEGYDLLVIGSRGHGASKAVLGSVASKLVRHPGLPVLIAGA
jgi:nucleotide-binding universal stress UspA family protein